ncbi:MAG: hypothetical protein A2749_00795 [Parcubacteria group bacterium RIFCSPHIGHO2_01_FULL_45_26]|nr:MAG: hypothetical protein A2749_00795 [Parcubacteria group bacterium RIFCSPHIGHO2_01_FULL_45_26]
MFEWLNKLRQKPEPMRRLIAFWASTLIVFAMILVWLTNLSSSFGAVSKPLAELAKDDKARELASPFASLKNEFNALVENTRSKLRYESKK